MEFRSKSSRSESSSTSSLSSTSSSDNYSPTNHAKSSGLLKFYIIALVILGFFIYKVIDLGSCRPLDPPVVPQVESINLYRSTKNTVENFSTNPSNPKAPTNNNKSEYRYPFYPDYSDVEEEMASKYNSCTHEVWCNVPPPKQSFFAHSLGEEFDMARWKRAQAMAASSKFYFYSHFYSCVIFYLYFSFR